jgi:hypothetical protein
MPSHKRLSSREKRTNAVLYNHTTMYVKNDELYISASEIVVHRLNLELARLRGSWSRGHNNTHHNNNTHNAEELFCARAPGSSYRHPTTHLLHYFFYTAHLTKVARVDLILRGTQPDMIMNHNHITFTRNRRFGVKSQARESSLKIVRCSVK